MDNRTPKFEFENPRRQCFVKRRKAHRPGLGRIPTHRKFRQQCSPARAAKVAELLRLLAAKVEDIASAGCRLEVKVEEAVEERGSEKEKKRLDRI